MLYAYILIMLLVAVIVDLKIGKIPNSFNGFCIGCGLIMNFVSGGTKGVMTSVVGIFIPVVGLMVLFAFDVVGAGDIKLFAGIGAFVGLDIVWIVAYSFLLCGSYGGILIIIRLVNGLMNGNIRAGIIKLITKNRQYTKVAFSIFILGGFLWYLLKGGLRLGI